MGEVMDKNFLIDFQLVKNIYLWNIHEIWHTKLRNSVSKNCKTPDEGVDNFQAIYKDGSARDVEEMHMCFRADGSFYLVIYIDNKETHNIEHYKKIVWRTGCKATWKFGDWNNPDKLSGTASLKMEQHELNKKEYSYAGRYNTNILLRCTNDKWGDDDDLKKVRDDIVGRHFGTKIVVDLQDGKKGSRFKALTALRVDEQSEGTKWYNPVSWGKDMKVGLIVSREGIPASISNQELQYRIQYLEIGDKKWAFSVETQRKLIAVAFIRSFDDYINHKCGPEDFQQDIRWGAIAAWTGCAAVAIGVAGVYVWHKMSGFGGCVAKGGKKFCNWVGDCFDSDEDKKKDNKKGSKDSSGWFGNSSDPSDDGDSRETGKKDDDAGFGIQDRIDKMKQEAAKEMIGG